MYRVSDNSRPTLHVHIERVKPSRKVLYHFAIFAIICGHRDECGSRERLRQPRIVRVPPNVIIRVARHDHAPAAPAVLRRSARAVSDLSPPLSNGRYMYNATRLPGPAIHSERIQGSATSEQVSKPLQVLLANYSTG